MFRRLLVKLSATLWGVKTALFPTQPAPGLRSCHKCGNAVFRRCPSCFPKRPAEPPPRPLGVDWSAEDVAKCLAVFWNLGLTNPDDPGQRMEQDGPTVTLLDTAGKPQRFRLVREFPELGSDS